MSGTGRSERGAAAKTGTLQSERLLRHILGSLPANPKTLVEIFFDVSVEKVCVGVFFFFRGLTGVYLVHWVWLASPLPASEQGSCVETIKPTVSALILNGLSLCGTHHTSQLWGIKPRFH